ncbi:MAG: amidase family protein [Pseudomonadota bacterium]
MADEWRWTTAADLGRGIASGDIDPVSLAECYLDAARTDPAAPSTYARLTEDRAMAEARAARHRAQSGTRLGLLDGVPISWKDLFDTAGVGTEAGSALLKGRVPDQDAECLAAATARGTVCLGKTHMTELAFSGLGLNPITATPPCVNNRDAVPGGSSSGAATSVAFGLAAVGIGSDTGGSVRIPSAWNDLVGLKTTSGLISLKGVVPLCETFDTVGPLCRSVEDASLMLEAMTGISTDLTGADLKGRRFGICKSIALDDLDAPVAKGFEMACARLESFGAKLESVELPSVEAVMGDSAVLFTVEAYSQWQDEIEANGDVMFSEIRSRFEAGLQFSGVDYMRAFKKMMKLRQDYLVETAGFDAILAPTSPIMPPNKDRLSSDGDYYVRSNLLALRNTRIGNLMGLCGLTLPSGIKSAGLMMLAPPMQERRLLRLGAAAEKALR